MLNINLKDAVMYRIIILFTVLLMLSACGKSGDAQLESKASGGDKATETASGADSKGVGPIKSVTIGEIDPAMAKEGETIFNTNCVACHKLDVKLVGPPLNGITKKQTPEWIMNMILNPEEMVKKDPVAKKLLEEYIAPMANLHLTEDQARKLLEFFRQNDSK